MNAVKQILERYIPKSVVRVCRPPYHFALAFFSALVNGFPANKLIVIGVTGTKGKSSVSEMLATVLEEAGHTVALSSTIRFKIGEKSIPNHYKMTLPGRGFIQRFLRDAVRAECDVAVIEISSEAAVQYRHLFLSQDALVFTNLQKEHLESHGGMENYFKAKMKIGRQLLHSPKKIRTIVANADDAYGRRFLELPVDKHIPFSYNDASAISFGEGASFTLEGVPFEINQPGVFSIMNAIAVAKTAYVFGVSFQKTAETLKLLTKIPGRAERVECGQTFTAVVDYAHTPDSLRALYDAYPARKICVLGNTGGGRDTWKRPDMGRIADALCAEVILTNEDPYDEDPRAIVDAMVKGMTREPHIIMDRREAIRTALSYARAGDAVLISGKGTDPYIMGANGSKQPWSDADVVREELTMLLNPSQK